MFEVLDLRFKFAYWNKRNINETVKRTLCGDFAKKGCHNKLAKNSIPVIIQRAQIDLSTLVPSHLVTEEIGDVIWRDITSDILVANGRHREKAYRDFIASLEKTLKKAQEDLQKNLKKKGAKVDAQVIQCQNLIETTEEQLSGLGTWLGTFYDDGELCDYLISSSSY